MASVASGTELQSLILEESDAAARITLNRPEKRNALSLELMHELQRARWSRLGAAQ